MMSLNTTPTAKENPALKPFSMLVLIMEKNTGPVKNENKIPAPIPCNIVSNIQLNIYNVLICNFKDKTRLFFLEVLCRLSFISFAKTVEPKQRDHLHLRPWQKNKPI